MSNIDESLEVVSQVLVRCVVMGVAVLLIWWAALLFVSDLTYAVHSFTAPISRAQFDVIHYVGILSTKAAVSLLFFFPYVAIRLVIKKRAQ